MKPKSFDAVRQKSRALAVLLWWRRGSCTGTARVCSGGGQNGHARRRYLFFSGGTRAFGTGIGVQFDGRV